MEKKLAKRKKTRRKYAAALAGAAIMAGTSLHGIPVAGAAAANNPSIAPPVTTEQAALLDKTIKKPIIENDTNVTDPVVIPDQGDKSANDKVATPDKGDKNKDDRAQKDKRDQKDNRYNHERHQHERWADRGQALYQRIAWYNDSSNKIQINIVNANPVDIVRAAADGLGFDVNNDTFTLLSQSGSQSIVRVVHKGNNYDITVDQLSNNNWRVSFVNQIR